MDDRIGIASVIFLALVLGGAGVWQVLRSPKKTTGMWGWMLVLFLLQTLTLVNKSTFWHECPIRGISEVLFLMGWALNLFYLILGRLYRMSVMGIFTAPAIALCSLASLLTFSPLKFPMYSQWLAWHIGIAMLAYGALGLVALAGCVFLIQNHFLKDHHVKGVSSKLPPIRTLHQSMKRLLAAGFVLLMSSQVFGYVVGVHISLVKGTVAGLISALYLVLLLFVYGKGMPGRTLAWCSVALYLLSLAIFFVLK